MQPHSTAVPIKLPEKLIREVHANHVAIVAASKNRKRENTGDAQWAVTRSATIPPWSK
jgi:deoxycytidylate deaminase